MQSTFITVQGVRLHVVVAGEGPAVLLVHGWPDFHRVWRLQIPALVEAGFTVIAPDLRGFNLSDAPTSVEAYAIDPIVADLTGILDAVSVEKAAFVGHDWGGQIVWHAALLAPDRVSAAVSLCTPWKGRGLVRPTQEYRRLPDGRFNYILEFQTPDAPEQRFMANLDGELTRIAELASHDASFWTADIRREWVDAFTRSGMHSINLYRNLDGNWLRMKQLLSTKVMLPALMITAEHDPILIPQMAIGMQAHVPQVRVHEVKGAGHWVQLEKADEVNRVLVEFLRSVEIE